MFGEFYNGTESIKTAKKDLVLLKKYNKLLDKDGDGAVECA